MPKIITTTKVEKDNTIIPCFKFEGKTNYFTSGYLKYFTFIPEGTKVKVTIEWEKKDA